MRGDKTQRDSATTLWQAAGESSRKINYNWPHTQAHTNTHRQASRGVWGMWNANANANGKLVGNQQINQAQSNRRATEPEWPIELSTLRPMCHNVSLNGEDRKRERGLAKWRGKLVCRVWQPWRKWVTFFWGIKNVGKQNETAPRKGRKNSCNKSNNLNGNSNNNNMSCNSNHNNNNNSHCNKSHNQHLQRRVSRWSVACSLFMIPASPAPPALVGILFIYHIFNMHLSNVVVVVVVAC